jgi:hypothetical protein
LKFLVFSADPSPHIDCDGTHRSKGMQHINTEDLVGYMDGRVSGEEKLAVEIIFPNATIA